MTRIIDTSKPITGVARVGIKYLYVTWHNCSQERINKNRAKLKDGILWLNQNQ